MMIVEYIGDRVRHYSDQGVYIQQEETGILYEDAVDILPCPYTYTETDQPIEEDITVEDKAAAYDILMGGEEV